MVSALSQVPANSLPVVFLMGPTATGKTDAAAYLSEHLPVELISVDSSLVYRGMDIGTAKPDADFLARYPHHLIDIRDPDQTYSAADFINDSTALIQSITERGRIPILVGGTSFYFAALENGLPDLPGANAEIRQRLQDQADQLGWGTLHKQLKEKDPVSAARIDANDPQRIQRALEIIELTGKPVRSSEPRPQIPNPLIKIALSFADRKLLHDRIHQRYIQMVDAGLVAEVQALINSGFDKNLPAFKMIGYRQTLDFLEHALDLDKMVESGVIATRQLAKRQLTWLRNQSHVLWWVDDEKLLGKCFNQLLLYLRQMILVLTARHS